MRAQKGKQSNFSVKKPGKHYLMIVVNITNNVIYPLIHCDEKGTPPFVFLQNPITPVYSPHQEKNK